MAATDSFRLGEQNISLKALVVDSGDRDIETFFPSGIILPQRICHYISRLNADDLPSIMWYIHENHLSVQCGDLYITTRLIDGNYPDYTQIIPTSTETNTIIRKDDLIESMRVMMVFAHNEAHEIFVRFSEEGLTVQTPKQENGSSETHLKASVSGDAKEVVLNPRYVLEGVQNIESDEIFIGVNTDSSPVVLYGSSEEGIDRRYTHIVMPIKNN